MPGDELRIAFGGHAVCHGVPLRRQNVVDGFVRVCTRRKIIIALFQDVRPFAVGIVAFELVFRHRDRELLRFAGGQLFGLGKTDQFDGRLFDPVFPVVIGVRFLQIYLHHLFTRSVSDVGDRHADVIVAAVLFHRIIAVLEIGIAQPVTEGIGDLVCIRPRPAPRHDACGGVCIPAAEHRVFVARFIIAVADVDPFLIDDIAVVRFADIGIVVYFVDFAAVSEIAVVDGGGRRCGLICPGVRQMPGRVCLAHEDVDERFGRSIAAIADPEAGVDMIVFEGVDIHRIGKGDHEDDLFDLSCGTEFAQPLQNALLLRRQIQFVRQRTALAGDAPDGIDGDVSVRRHRFADRIARIVLQLRPGNLFPRPLQTAHHRVVAVGIGLIFQMLPRRVQKRLVAVKAVRFQRLGQPGADIQAGIAQNADVLPQIDVGAARAVVRPQVDDLARAVVMRERLYAESADVLLFGGVQRQRIVFVPEQDHSLFVDALGHLQRLRLHLFVPFQIDRIF